MNITIDSIRSTSLISNEFGDIIPGSELGLYDFDTRYLNQFELSFSGYQFNKTSRNTGRLSARIQPAFN